MTDTRAPSTSDVAHSGAAFITLLNDIENDLDPATFVAAEFNFWPVLRFAINYNRKMGSVETKAEYAKRRIWQRGIKMRVNALHKLAKTLCHKLAKSEPDVQFREAELGKLPQLQQADVLFFNRSKQYSHAISGHAIQPFTDSLRHLTKSTQANCITVVDRDPRLEGEDCLVDPCILPQYKPASVLHLRVPRTLKDFSTRKLILARLRDVNKLLRRDAPDLVLSEERILRQIETAFINIQRTDQMLQVVRPKVVFLSSYTGAYQVCAACEARSIPVIDVQHGGMHAYHPLAANWRNVPVKGYNLLPDIFWCWNERTAEIIASTLSLPHRSIVGGNPKIAHEHAAVLDQSKQAPPQVERRSWSHCNMVWMT